MLKEKEKLTPFDRFRERHERIDGLCDWLEEHWEDVVLYSLSAAIFVLITIFVLIMCSACNETTPSMYPTSRSLHVGMPSMCPTSRSLHVGKPPDVPHIVLPARGKAPDVPHIALPACGKARDVPHIALHARGNAPRCTPQRTIF